MHKIIYVVFMACLLISNVPGQYSFAQGTFSIEEDYWKNSKKYVSRSKNFSLTFPGKTFRENGGIMWADTTDWCLVSPGKAEIEKTVAVLKNGDSRLRFLKAEAMRPIEQFKTQGRKVQVLSLIHI